MMNYRRTGIALLLALLLPAAAFGQEDHRHGADAQPENSGMMGMQGAGMGAQMADGGTMMMGDSMDMKMMNAMMAGPNPAAILKQREALGLGPDQVRDLEGLQTQARIGREARMAQMKDLHARLSGTLSSDAVDVAEYEAVLQKMANQRVAMHVQDMALGQQALTVLTEEQRAKLRPEHTMMGADGAAGRNCSMGGAAAEQGD